MSMSQPEWFENLVLGSGAGGKLLAWHLAKSGRRTAVVERKWIGGSCPNINCLPSKNEIWSAKVADLMHHAAKFGMVTGSTAIDMGRVRQRKRDMVEGLIAMHLDHYRASGTELIMATGRIVAPKTTEVTLKAGGGRVLACCCACGRPAANHPRPAATSWPRRDVLPPPPGSDSKWPASNSTRGATSRLTTGSKPRRPRSGRSASVPAAHSSRTYPSTT